MTTASTLETALIAAATSVVVAVGTQVVTWRRERSRWQRERAQRAGELRVAAVREAQEAVLTVRARFEDFSAAARVATVTEFEPAFAAAQRGLRDALAALDVRLGRVDDTGLVAAVRAWRDRARFHSISGEEVTDAEEQAAWDEMNRAFAAAERTALNPPAEGTPGSS